MRYYIVTGESSGDMHAANLVSKLKKLDKSMVVRAWGGKRLISEEVSLARDITKNTVMGFWSVIKNLKTLNSDLNFCKEDILSFKADALILVDYPGFNLKIAEFAKKNGIKVFYYIPPKVWAWNKRRIFKLKKFIDYLLVIFPFEVEFYKTYGLEVTYVGNPLLDEIAKQNFSLSLKYSRPVIALLPGSRRQEIELILPEMLKVISSFPEYQFVIAATTIFSKGYYQSFIKDKDVLCVYDQTYGLLSKSQAAIVTSGTATLEAALFNVPQVVCYKTNWLTYILARALIGIKYLSLVNILLDKEVVKELIQAELNKENIKKELTNLFIRRDNFLSDYENIRNLLNKKGASKNAASFIFSSF